jgi:1-acyl-sn-glycerol-3-phosphate acyltransferase
MNKLLRTLTTLVLKTLTRVTVQGREHIPNTGPLLIVGNHTSTIDGPMLIIHLPESARFVGPGDFKLLFPANYFIKWYGIIPIRRSAQLEKSALKAMTDVLKGGGMLGIFPDGGTWEKPITDAKEGVAYLSMTTGAAVLPVGISNAYLSWEKAVRLQRPHITLNFGEVIPPLQQPTERSKRAEALTEYTRMLTTRIYELLTPQERARYDDLARRRYKLNVLADGVLVDDLPGASALGELMQKPNLISPLVNNAKLPLTPMVKHGKAYPAAIVKRAAESLLAALAPEGIFPDYFEYRWGVARANLLRDSLRALSGVADRASQITLIPGSTLES